MVYLAGFALIDGQNMSDVSREGPDQDLSDNILWSDDGYASIRSDALDKVFYADCSSEDQIKAAVRLVPQAALPLIQPMADKTGYSVRPAKFGIVYTQDRAIDPALQRKMYEQVDATIWEMEASHSPFLSQPKALGEIALMYVST